MNNSPTGVTPSNAKLNGDQAVGDSGGRIDDASGTLGYGGSEVGRALVLGSATTLNISRHREEPSFQRFPPVFGSSS